MTIYQGEPISFTLADKEGETYIPDISDYQLEALLRDGCGRMVRGWSAEKGTILFDSVEGKGIAVFKMHGSETASLEQGNYTLEIARVFSDGRAIGILKGVIVVEMAKIKEGIR